MERCIYSVLLYIHTVLMELFIHSVILYIYTVLLHIYSVFYIFIQYYILYLKCHSDDALADVASPFQSQGLGTVEPWDSNGEPQCQGWGTVEP